MICRAVLLRCGTRADRKYSPASKIPSYLGTGWLLHLDCHRQGQKWKAPITQQLFRSQVEFLDTSPLGRELLRATWPFRFAFFGQANSPGPWSVGSDLLATRHRC